jgi:hypothetical protein
MTRAADGRSIAVSLSDALEVFDATSFVVRRSAFFVRVRRSAFVVRRTKAGRETSGGDALNARDRRQQ